MKEAEQPETWGETPAVMPTPEVTDWASSDPAAVAAPVAPFGQQIPAGEPTPTQDWAAPTPEDWSAPTTNPAAASDWGGATTNQWN